MVKTDKPLEENFEDDDMDRSSRVKSRRPERQEERSEKVLEATSLVDRKEFVSQELHKSAYNDSPLPAGYDQTVSIEE